MDRFKSKPQYKRRAEPVPDTGFFPLVGRFDFANGVDVDPVPDDDDLAKRLNSFEQFHRDSEKMADF
jgi:hypothetical protein